MVRISYSSTIYITFILETAPIIWLGQLTHFFISVFLVPIMLLIGFCVNILVAGIYYAFVGIFNGVRKMFYRPNTISALLITQGIYTKDVSSGATMIL